MSHRRNFHHNYKPRVRCGICSHVIDGGYVKHHGRHCHWSCWAGTNEQPDILALEGDYAEVA